MCISSCEMKSFSHPPSRHSELPPLFLARYPCSYISLQFSSSSVSPYLLRLFSLISHFSWPLFLHSTSLLCSTYITLPSSVRRNQLIQTSLLRASNPVERNKVDCQHRFFSYSMTPPSLSFSPPPSLVHYSTSLPCPISSIISPYTLSCIHSLSHFIHLST